MVFFDFGSHLLLLRLQLSSTSYKDLFNAKTKMNEEVRQLRHNIELKDAQIASLEEARKKDEGDNYSLPSFRPTSF